jgi:sugar lactone lactonase YvrE
MLPHSHGADKFSRNHYNMNTTRSLFHTSEASVCSPRSKRLRPSHNMNLFATILASVLLSAGMLVAQPNIAAQPTNLAVWPGGTATFSVSVAGQGPLAYHWRFNGANLSSNLILTIAGTGTAGYAGDNGQATNARVSQPTGVAVDSAGGVYIADSSNSRVRRVNTNGDITTVAGGGSSGDGGMATNAALGRPYGVSLDSIGNLFIVDPAKHRVRKVDTNGVITTVAGNGTNGFSGDGGTATNAQLSSPQGVAVDTTGNLFIADTSNNRIRKVDTSGSIMTVAGQATAGNSGDGGPASSALLNHPAGIAFDSSGNLFIADWYNQRIRKIDTNGIISTVAGSSAGYSGDGGSATNAKLNYPTGVAVDPSGNIFIADTANNRIRAVDTNGIITTIVGTNTVGYSGDGGAPTSAKLNNPTGVALDTAGNLCIADQKNNRVREVVSSGSSTLVLTNVGVSNVGDYFVVVAGAGGSVTSSVASLRLLGPPIILSQPASQTVWAGGNASFTVTATGSLPMDYLYQNGSTYVQDGTNATLALSNLTTSGAGNYTVVITNDYGSVTSSVAVLTVDDLVSQPTAQTVLAGSNITFTVGVVGGSPFQYQWQFNGTNLANDLITTVAGTGSDGYSGDGGPATNARIALFGGIALDPYGNLYLPHRSLPRIRKVDTNGIIWTVAGNGQSSYGGDGGPATNASLNGASGVAADGFGNLFIADGGNNRVRKVDPNGIITTIAGTGALGYSGDGGQATNAQLSGTSGVCLDTFGNLYIADWRNNCVRKIAKNGIITTVAGGPTGGYSGDGGQATKARLDHPFAVAVDASGNLYIADYNNYRVRKVDTNGIISTIAGNGSNTSSGDGGAATNAGVYNAIAVAIDRTGNLYIATYSSFVVRRVDPNGIITTVAGNGTLTYSGDGGAATNAGIDQPSGVAVDAAGNLFLDGQFEARKVALAGFPTLTLNQVTTKNAGSYSVIITSPGGSITSAVATLTVQVTPSISSIAPQPDGTVALSLSGTPSSTNRLWVATSLASPAVWTPISTNIASPDGTWQCSDPGAVGWPLRFYRVTMP